MCFAPFTALSSRHLSEANMFWLLFLAVVDHKTTIKSLVKLQLFIQHAMQTNPKTDHIADLQFSTCFTTTIFFWSDLLQGFTAPGYGHLHMSSLNKSVSFELCKQKSAPVSTFAGNLFLSIELFPTGDLRWLPVLYFQDEWLKQIVQKC